MFLDVMPDILNPLLRPGIVQKVCLEQKPFHAYEGEMVVFKDEVLHVKEGPGRSPFKNPILHLLIDGCSWVWGEDAELGHIGIESLRKTDSVMNRFGGIVEPSQDIGGMNLQAIPF